MKQMERQKTLRGSLLLLIGAVSLLTLPLYRRAEAIQRREAEKEFKVRMR